MNELITETIVPESNKLVNYICYCKKYFYNKDSIIILEPCGHMIHEKCINEYIFLKLDTNNLNINNKKISLINPIELQCPICDTNINRLLSEKKVKKNKKYLQHKTDIESVKIDDSSVINYTLLPLGILKITTCMNKLILANSENDILDTLEYLLKMCNIKINIIDNTKNNPIKFTNNTIQWKNKLDSDANVVLISNHSNYIDSFILFYLFKCGFVSSDFLNSTDIGRLIAAKCNVLIFKRGKDTNMVQKIKEYLETQKSIVIYPEGGMGNPNTLFRFRTGAFYTGSPVCPIIIRYKPFIWDDDFKTFVFKLTTQTEIIVDVTINDLVYPPFDDRKINMVREYMAKVGNLKLSRVSNKGIKE